ncbi:T9SS C-terminal target domain-containing protein [Flavobacterium magnum]|uniref:T9SS C-terminal target domain-containing protein n=1 Tax=Flavobacterium magnum TaxID=2162713 RepID=A0A2S0RI47_9FLAO|nr:T9SS type A sorting domain-containing protein [Flavobacterium magnum]AWA30402.1 T9SS C-terminal target domain-containing protein [Flavobacterium magnum]
MKNLYLFIIAICCISVNAQIVDIPDTNFKLKLLAASASNQIAKNLSNQYFKIDQNDNGQIEVSEALQVSYLDAGNYTNPMPYFSDVTGIKSFENLKWFSCEFNQIASIDVSGLSGLKYLDFQANNLLSMNLNGLINLESLDCSENELQAFDFNPFITLKELYCRFNHFTSIDFSPLVNLEKLSCSYCMLSSLDVSTLTQLKLLHCESNPISSIDLSELHQLETLYIGDNNIVTLDVTYSDHLQSLACSNSLLLEHILLKSNSFDVNGLYMYNVPSLHYICTSEPYRPFIESFLQSYGFTNVIVNDYCMLHPADSFYSIKTNLLFDNDNNGCEISEAVTPSMEFQIERNGESANVFYNGSGDFIFPSPEGEYIITPLFDTDYFNISPSSVTVQFPSQPSPSIQDFCITANGNHPDLEISVLPLNMPFPGDHAEYKIIFKNKGNQAQSGAISFAYDDAVVDFFNANPAHDISTTGLLTWNFNNLKPLQSGVIWVNMELNSPTDTPDLNSGDVLNYTASIISADPDETPEDNTFQLTETVINSFDPNNKVCLEGKKVLEETVGKYVHYIIHFENTGSANARNIVIKDIINAARFDAASLVPLDGSHPFVTRRRNNNTYEFIFENIQLPFDDANNDGYVAFKIKTSPTLVAGDSFRNKASIYFDYNMPVITNNTLTTVQSSLGIDDFDLNNHFTLFPNPVDDILNIKSKDNAVIHSLSVYNVLGQLVLTVANPMESIDLSGLTTGTYVISIVTDKGKASSKFIKK